MEHQLGTTILKLELTMRQCRPYQMMTVQIKLLLVSTSLWMISTKLPLGKSPLLQWPLQILEVS